MVAVPDLVTLQQIHERRSDCGTYQHRAYQAALVTKPARRDAGEPFVELTSAVNTRNGNVRDGVRDYFSSARLFHDVRQVR